MESSGDAFFAIFPILFMGLSILLTLLPLALIIIVFVFVVRVVRRAENRSEERLSIERQTLELKREQLDLMRGSKKQPFTEAEQDPYPNENDL